MDIASDSIERVTRSSGNVIYVTSYRPLIRARTAGDRQGFGIMLLEAITSTTLNAPKAHGDTGKRETARARRP